jgi:hypothetical protein
VDYSARLYSTTDYNTIVDGDTVWVEIPKEIYYTSGHAKGPTSGP